MPDQAPSVPGGQPPGTFPVSDAPAAPADLAGLFHRIPQVNAIKRPARFPGLAGWGRLQWLVLAGAAVVLFVMYGGLDAAAVGLNVGTILVSALLGSFIVATFAPRPGQRLALTPCGLMPLLWVVLLPMTLASGGPMATVLGVGMLGVFAVQRAMGAGCAV